MNVKPNNKRKIQSSIKNFYPNKKSSNSRSNSDSNLDTIVNDYNEISESTKSTESTESIELWYCTICGINMGSHNPRQYCGKYYCKMINSLIIKKPNKISIADIGFCVK